MQETTPSQSGQARAKGPALARSDLKDVAIENKVDTSRVDAQGNKRVVYLEPYLEPRVVCVQQYLIPYRLPYTIRYLEPQVVARAFVCVVCKTIPTSIPWRVTPPLNL